VIVFFRHPELLLLLAPAIAAAVKWRGAGRATPVVRSAVVLLLGLAIAGPVLRTTAPGRDLVIVADRSRSMPEGSRGDAIERIALAESERGEGDRVAVVSFGGRAIVDRSPSETATFGGFDREVPPDGSDLAAALDVALELVPEGREGSILVVSDGEANGPDPALAALRAFARGVRIDVLPLSRPPVADASIERLDLPERVAAGEPFQFAVWVRADERTEASFALERGDGETLSSGRRRLEPGLNRLLFRDVATAGGIASYRARVETAADRVPENDAGAGAVLVDGPRPILVLNDDGARDSLSSALESAGLPVSVRSPESARLDAVSLSSHRAIVLENVAAPRLGAGAREIREFVVERGGGLLVTGGKASFGTGGYFLSPLDDVLPVSLEMREEHRKQGIALAIALDRSGSMAAPVAGGLTKMDLANLGASAAIGLLSPIDQVSVVAVDSAPHFVQALTAVDDAREIAARVLGIEAGGGGIFCRTALLAAGRTLEAARPRNRHLILFADAADAEEQEECLDIVDRLGRMNATVSVIALGTEGDADAAFLASVAERGGGRVYFTTAPDALPQLFAQDTLTAARAAFLEERSAVRLLPDFLALGEAAFTPFPSIAGHNRVYLRPNATAGAITSGDDPAPIFAFAQRGLGRAAAYAGQVGGTFGAEVVAWDGFAPFFVTIARWLTGQEEPGSVFASVRREGASGVVSIEIDPEAPEPPDGSLLRARVRTGDGATRDVPLEPVGPNRLEGRFPLETEGIALATLALGDGRAVNLPPIALPYSPEFERSLDRDRGEKTLRKLASETGGVVAPAASELFRGPRGGRALRGVARELALAALVLLLLEIAGRRLALWGDVARLVAALGRRLPGRRAPAPADRPAKKGVAEPAPPGRGTEPPPAARPKTATETVGDALERAKRAASRRLGR